MKVQYPMDRHLLAGRQWNNAGWVMLVPRIFKLWFIALLSNKRFAEKMSIELGLPPRHRLASLFWSIWNKTHGNGKEYFGSNLVQIVALLFNIYIYITKIWNIMSKSFSWVVTFMLSISSNFCGISSQVEKTTFCVFSDLTYSRLCKIYSLRKI